jgi:hypothetical protein
LTGYFPMRDCAPGSRGFDSKGEPDAADRSSGSRSTPSLQRHVQRVWHLQDVGRVWYQVTLVQDSYGLGTPEVELTSCDLISPHPGTTPGLLEGQPGRPIQGAFRQRLHSSPSYPAFPNTQSGHRAQHITCNINGLPVIWGMIACARPKPGPNMEPGAI